MRHARKRADANHFEIARHLRGLGLGVIDIHHGSLGADLLVPHHKTGEPHFIELKDPAQPPSGRKLTESERDMQARYPRHWHLCLTLEDVLRAIGLIVDVPASYATDKVTLP
jgi:hypothetical protein